jgi:hypothetical protein
MSRQTQKIKSIFPSVPRSSQAVDQRGHLTAQWSLAFNNLFESLQQNFSNEGFSLPVLNAEQQAMIENSYQKLIGSRMPPGVKDITGYRIIDAPYYDGGVTPRVPKVFIIEYNTDRKIVSAQWKTYTIT